ncbi:putative phage tail protein [Desulforamulus ruminis]|uniref:putative phage tail protein n=1 Tax=Desulforamulus ruminis TaxID=1564 RepID=UPI0023555372|nr:putative phage tail protein [Desulforamulus ruminis]
MNRLLAYLPEYYHDVVDFKELTAAEEPEFISLDQAIQQLFDDQFVMTGSEQATKRREKMLGIQADPTTETLDFRRRRIVNRYSTKPPLTIRFLQQRLDFLVGPGRAITSVDVQNFVLTVTAALDDAAVFREVERTVKQAKPANMVYRQETAIEDTIALEEHISMRALTRKTRLSTTWRLGVVPFAEMGPEVILK